MDTLINDQKLSVFSYHLATWKYDKIKSGFDVTDDEVEKIIKKYLKILKKKKVIEVYNNYDFERLFWFTKNINKKEIINNLKNQKYSYKDFEQKLNTK